MNQAIPLRKCGSPFTGLMRSGPRRKRNSAATPAGFCWYGPQAQPLYRARGLGDGLPTASAVTATGAGTAATIIAAAGVTGPLAPIVAAAGAVAALFLKFFGGGCGDACINAAKVEQIYEAGALMLRKVADTGMISRDETIQGMQMLIQAGQQHEAQLGDEHAQDGAKNLQKVIEAEISRASSLPTEPTADLDLAKARALYGTINGRKWYEDSKTAAQSIVDSYLATLAAAPARQAAQLASSLKQAGINPALALVGLGILAWWAL